MAAKFYQSAFNYNKNYIFKWLMGDGIEGKNFGSTTNIVIS